MAGLPRWGACELTGVPTERSWWLAVIGATRHSERTMTTVLIATALFCLSLPAALLLALVYNDRDAQRAEHGTDLR